MGTRRKFTREFKEEAVRRPGLGVSVAEAAKACEVNANVLHRWRREIQEFGMKAFAGNGQRRADDSQMAELVPERFGIRQSSIRRTKDAIERIRLTLVAASFWPHPSVLS